MFWSKKEKFWLPKFEMLAIYNGEVLRGVMHTLEMKDKMLSLQAEYDKRLRDFYDIME